MRTARCFRYQRLELRSGGPVRVREWVAVEAAPYLPVPRPVVRAWAGRRQTRGSFSTAKTRTRARSGLAAGMRCDPAGHFTVFSATRSPAHPRMRSEPNPPAAAAGAERPGCENASALNTAYAGRACADGHQISLWGIPAVECRRIVHAVGREDDLGFCCDEAVLTAPRVRHVHRAVYREGAYTRYETAVLIGPDYRGTSDCGH
jgi:hypothetical protein